MTAPLTINAILCAVKKIRLPFVRRSVLKRALQDAASARADLFEQYEERLKYVTTGVAQLCARAVSITAQRQDFGTPRFRLVIEISPEELGRLFEWGNDEMAIDMYCDYIAKGHVKSALKQLNRLRWRKEA